MQLAHLLYILFVCVQCVSVRFPSPLPLGKLCKVTLLSASCQSLSLLSPAAAHSCCLSFFPQPTTLCFTTLIPPFSTHPKPFSCSTAKSVPHPCLYLFSLKARCVYSVSAILVSCNELVSFYPLFLLNH